MATISWSAGVSGAWTDASKWSPTAVPGASDDALIGAPGTYVVTIPSETVNSITLSDPSATLLSGSALTINNALSITSGTLDIATGTVNVIGAFINAGTVIDSGTLQLFGGYSVADLERIGGTGGSLSLANALDNTGGTFDGSGLANLRILGLGTILGGTVTGIHQAIGGTLVNVTWRGRLETANSVSTIIGSLTATGANGSGPGTIVMDGGSLVFQGGTTLDNATVVGSGAVIVDDTLTLGPSLVLDVTNFSQFTMFGGSPVAGTIINDGTFDVIGQTIFSGDSGVLAVIENQGFDNHGTVETSGTGGRNGDAVMIINAATFVNEAGALLDASAGRILINGTTALTNNGTIAANGGSIDIGTLLQGTGQLVATNGGGIEFAGAVAATETISVSGTTTLTLDQPALFMGTIEGFAPGATIDLGVTATPVSYSAGDLKLLVSGGQTLDLHIAGPFSLANFVAVTQGGTTAIQVNGSSAAAPLVQGAGNIISYVATGPAVAIDPGLTISDTESPTLTGATVSVSKGGYPGDGDILSALTTGTGIIASFNATTEVLSLSGRDTLADYQRVLRSVAFDSGAADPTKATSQPSRAITWVINDGTATSAPVTSTVNLQPPPRVLTWVGTQGSGIFTAANWDDTTNSVSPANLAPDAADSADFGISGGTITGSGTIGSIAFAGSDNWLLDGSTSLDAVDGIGDGGAVTLVSGATIISQGNLDSVSATGGNAALLTISGTDALWDSLGALVVGEQSASGALTIENQGALISGGLVIGQAGGTGSVSITSKGSLQVTSGSFVVGSGGLGSLLIASGGDASVAGDAAIAGSGADGSNASVSGPGSTWQVAGALQIGNGAAGALAVTNGGTVAAAALDAGVQNVGTQQGVGQIDVSGFGSQIDISANVVIGDAGTGALSILGGGTLAATNLIIGNPTGDGAAFVSGAGSLLNLSGTLSVGVALGIGELTIGPGATVAAATARLRNELVNQGGTLAASQIEVASGAALVGSGVFGSPNAVIINNGTFSTSGGVSVGNGSIAGTGAVLIGDGSTLDLTGGVAASQSVAFTTSDGALIVQDPGDFQGVITQFAAGDQIFVEAPVFGGFRQQGSIVQVLTAGKVVGALDFATTALATAAATTDGALVYDIVPCFASGTRIAAERGDVVVEDLCEGDHLHVLGGKARPIIWIGHRTIDCTKHPSPEKVWPVRVRADAFGPGKPYRDLWLSPDHAVFIGGVLIPVKYLTNGASIAQLPVHTITYYHLELPRHAVLLAEGLPAESYLDTGDRANFANGGGVMALYPDFSSLVRDAEGCAPLVVTGHELNAARLMVNALAFPPHGRRDGLRHGATSSDPTMGSA
jgi:collagen type I/II/III/V/XI/XXIV/XXVII alpha